MLEPPIMGRIATTGSIRTATMKKRKCMADGGVIEQASRKVRQAVGGIADFLHVGKPAETTVLPPGQRRIPDDRPIVQADMRPDMPQERNPRRFAEEVDQRKQARSGGYADGGIIPVDIRSGLMDAVVRPIADDWAQANKAIKSIRNRYPTIDAAVGLHPAVAASQLANDVMSNEIGVDSAMNVLQAVPIVKRLSGAEKLLSKQSGPVVGGTKFVVDVPSTVRKNLVLTGAQAIGQPGEAFARGGIIPVRGKGTGTSDSIPAVLAGHEVRVSNGEGVAVLPAKTMRTPGALDAVEGIIAATNKRPPQPRTGGAGAYQTGVAGLVDDTAGRIVQSPAVTAPADGILAGIRDFASPTLPNMGPNLASAAAPPGTGQSQGFIGGADYSGGPDKNVGFVWSDGTPRVQPGQQGAVAPAAQAPGLLTMKERDIAAGLDPNRAYRPGTAGDPYAAAGGIAAAAQGRSAVPVADTAGVLPQMLDAVPGRRRGRRVPGYAGGGIMDALPVRYVPDAIDLARGQLETERARAADRASMSAYKAELATRDVMNARANEAANMQSAIDGAKSQPAIPPRGVPAQPIYRPNWTSGSNSQVLEGVVETAADQRMAAAGAAPRQLPAGQASTAVVPRSVDWTIGDAQTRGVVPRPYSPDFTMSGGPAVQSTTARGPQAGIMQSLPPPPGERVVPNVGGKDLRTAAASKKAKTMSPEAAAYTASRPAAPEAKAAAAAPKESFMSGANDALKSGMRGELPPGVGRKYTPVMDTVAGKTGSAIGNGVQKAARVLAPVAIGADALSRAATVAGVAQDPNASGYDVATAGAEQASQMAGGLAGAGIGATTALKLGIPLIAGSGTFAPVTAAGLGILGGGLGYYGGEKLVQGLTSAGRKAAGAVVGASTADQPVSPQQASYSNEGRQDAVRSSNVAEQQVVAPRQAVMPSLVSASMGRGFDPTKLQMADGYGAATNAAGKTLFVAPSQYQAADGSVTSDWRQTQQYKDAIERNAADKLRLAEIQALRQGRDPVATMAASRGIADAALNAPIERQVKQAQAQTAQLSAQQAQELNALYAAHQAATTTEEQARIAEMIRVRTGKDKQDEYAHASGGTTVNPTTMAVEKTPDVIYNRRTGQTRTAGQSVQSFSKSDVDAAIKAGASKEAVAARIRSLGQDPKQYGL